MRARFLLIGLSALATALVVPVGRPAAAVLPVLPGSTTVVAVLGRAGVPLSGVDAVVLNVTAAGDTASTYVTVWPTGQPRPGSANLNPVTDAASANLVVVQPGLDGSISIYQHSGVGDLVVDVVGWFGDRASPSTPSELHAVPPARALDTRTTASSVGPNTTVTLALAGIAGLPATGVASVLVDLAAVDATEASFITAWPSGTARPLASNVNSVPGHATANLAVVSLGSDGGIDLYNAAGHVDLIVDVLAWFATPGPDDLVAISPTRLIDTRLGVGPLGAGGRLVVPVAGQAGVPMAGTPGEVLVNITATEASAASYVSAGAHGAVPTATSSVNPVAGRTVANLAIVPVAPDGSIELFNDVGTVQLVVDLVGWVPAGSGLHLVSPTRLLDTREPSTSHVLPVNEAIIGYARDHHDYPASDIFAFCGARIVSPVDGVVVHVRRVDSYVRSVDDPALRGGRSWAVLGDDGVRYYGSHMDTIYPGIEVGVRVPAGTPIGTMGKTGDASACHLHFGISLPCAGTEWSVRRGVIWPWPYLDSWRAGRNVSPRVEIAQWSADHPTACADALADPHASEAG